CLVGLLGETDREALAAAEASRQSDDVARLEEDRSELRNEDARLALDLHEGATELIDLDAPACARWIPAEREGVAGDEGERFVEDDVVARAGESFAHRSSADGEERLGSVDVEAALGPGEAGGAGAARASLDHECAGFAERVFEMD